MPISVEEAKAFIKDGQKARESWLTWAERSWTEIKKRQRNNKIWSYSPNSVKKRGKYPVWHSIFKIRQPLILSRVGIPICKDTTQDGTDHIGATAALLKERLATNLAKSFNFLDVLEAARDDFLATCFGHVRFYYERDVVKEKVKERITPQQVPGTEEVVFLDAAGEVIESDDIGQDDEGFFIELDQIVDIENERIVGEPLLYKDILIDPDIRRWPRCERLAFKLHFSVPSFKAHFGTAAYHALPKDDDLGDDEATPKKQNLVVWEIWDRYEKKCYWLPDNGEEFIEPVANTLPEEFEEEEQLNGLYDLDGLFPCPEPLISNQSTDEFWPVPEYYQLVEIIEDIHTIFSRMMALTRAIRARVMFDSSIEGLKEALNEATEGDAFGVDNLAASLINNGGTLEAVVQYIPVEKMVAALASIYQAFEQRLNLIYKLTGTSDLLQGLVTDPTQRTFGERQMMEKYALNQLAEPQRKMQEFVRDCYELMTEMALKNFKDESLERYIIPATLPPVHQQNYNAALALLKDDRKRFRIELETDSTIALNEQYDKAMRAELVNTLTGAIEKVSNIATQQPGLLEIELHALKFMIQGFRQGKMFQQEINLAIDRVIQQTQQAAQQPQPDPAQIQIQIEQQKLAIEQQKAATEGQAKMMGIQLEGQVNGIKAQIDQMRLNLDAQNKAADRAVEVEKIRNDIAIAQARLMNDREMLLLKAQEIAAEDARENAKMAIEQEANAYRTQLDAAAQRLEEFRVTMDNEERWATERRLQQEADLRRMFQTVEIIAKQRETENAAFIARAEAASMQPRPEVREKVKVQRDPMGGVSGYEVEQTQK